MNRIYRLIWNTTLCCWTVASEHTKGRGKKATTTGAAVVAVALSVSLPVHAVETIDEDEERRGVSMQPFALSIPPDPFSVARGALFAAVPALSIHRQLALVSDSSYRDATITGDFSIVIGSRSSLNGGNSAAFGNQVSTAGLGASAFGFGSKAHTPVTSPISFYDEGPSAFGSYSRAEGIATTALGTSAQALFTNATAVGTRAKALGVDTLAVGVSASAGARNATAVGVSSLASGEGSVAVGRLARAAALESVALGAQARATGNQAISMGHSSQASASRAVALGFAAKAQSDTTTALGSYSTASGVGGVAIGSNAAVDTGAGVNGIAIGAGAKAGIAGWSGAVALGGNAAATHDGVALGHHASASAQASVALGRASIATENHTVSVGSATLKRRIVNLAEGTLSASSTDAVTGKQLFETNTRLTAATGQLNGTSTAIGRDAEARSSYDTAIGNAAKAAGSYSNAIGYSATSAGGNAVAIGTLAAATGNSAVSVGNRAGVDATSAYGVAMGYNAKVNANAGSGTALGTSAAANAAGSVALGSNSVATVDNTVSVGSASQKRAIVNVADANLTASSSEAVTGKQLFTTNQKVTTVTATANIAKSAADAAKVDAASALTKANLVGGLISQAAPDGTVRVGVKNSGARLDVRNSANANRTLTGLLDGAVSFNSSEAVTGNQLFTTNQSVDAATNTANAAKTTADAAQVVGSSALEKTNLLGGLVSQVSATGNVRLGGENTGALIDVRNKSNASRTLSGVADGALSTTSTEAVSGKQLNATNQNVTAAATAANTAKTTAEAAHALATSAQDTATLTAGLVGQVSPSDAVLLGAENTGSLLDVRNKNNAARTISGLADGAVSGNSSEAVTGRQLFATNASIASNAQSIADNLGNIDNNRSSIGSNREAIAGNSRGIGTNRDDIAGLRSDFDGYVPDLEGAVKFSDDRLIVDLERARLTGIRDGDISSATSSDAVSGGQLFATNERVNYLADQQQYVAVGSDDQSEAARAGWLAVAVGDSAVASLDGEGATAIGSFADARATNSVALGRGAAVASGSRDGFALGAQARVEVLGGLAIGGQSVVESSAANGVALGYQSIAAEINSVSVGNDRLKRKITNVAMGTNDNDTTTVAQLRGALDVFGSGARLDGAGNVISPEYIVQGSTHDNVGDALTALDGSVDANGKSLGSLDSRLNRLFQEESSARADGPGRLNLGGANGMVLGNVANGLIASGSRDAVNGGQLYEVRKDLQSQIDNLEGQGNDVAARMGRMGAPVAMSSEAPAVAVQGDVASASEAHADPVANVDTPEPVVKAEGDNAVAVGSEGKERSVKHVAKGSADTDAVNVAQLNDLLDRATEYTDIAVEGLNKRLDGMDKRFNRMAAMSSAQSAMAMNTAGLNTYNRLGAGVGHSDGESALAVGYQRVMNERGSATFSLNGAFTNSGEKTVGVGVGIGW